MGDFLPLEGIDHIEWYVGNARQSAHYFKSALGFRSLAYAGPETGQKDRVSYVLSQGSIRLVLTTPLHAGSEIATHLHVYGDSVKSIALCVPDATKAFLLATQNGAQPCIFPERLESEEGEVILAAIHAYADTIHTFVERKKYTGTFLPGYTPWENHFKPSKTGLYCIDHISGHVSKRDIKRWRDFYRNTMGFSSESVALDDRFDQEAATMLYRTLDSNNPIRFPIHEAGTEAVSRAFHSVFMEWAKIPGVNHVALRTDNIVATISLLKERGVEFWPVERLPFFKVMDQMSHANSNIARLRDLSIMPTKDTWGHMLRVFTRPLEDRQRVCLEIVQRLNEGEGEKYKMLFDAMESYS